MMANNIKLNILILFHFLIFSVPLFFRFETEELFEFNKLMLTYGITLLIVGGWLCRMVLEQRTIWRQTIFDLPIALFLISQILSTVFSIHPYTSWLGYYTRFHGGLLSTFTYIALYYAFTSNFSKKEIRPLMLTASISAIIVSLYAILEHFGYSFSCFLISQGVAFDTTCWVQDVQNRVFATFGQPNWLAAYLITILPVSFFLAIRTTKQTWRWVLFSLANLLFFTALLYTKSRSGLLGLGAGASVFTTGLFLMKYKQQEQLPLKSLINYSRLSLLAGVMIVLSIIVGTSYTPALSSLWRSTPDNAQLENNEPLVANRLEIGGTDSGEIRKIVWEGALQVWKRYPIFGSGVETFAYSYYLDRPVEHNLVSEWDFLYNKAHNEFLNFLATTGLLGFSSYVLLLGWAMWVSWKYINQHSVGLNRKQEFANQGLALGFASGIVGLSVSNFFGFSTVMVSILLFLYLAFLAVLHFPTSNIVNKLKKSKAEQLNWLDYLFLMLISLAMIWGGLQLNATWKADINYAAGKTQLRAGQWQTGLGLLEKSIKLSSDEALYYDELSINYAQLAVALAEANEATAAAQLALEAIKASDAALARNDVHLNFYKTRVRVYLILAALDESYILSARDTLIAAIQKSPTDAKLVYNLALVELSLNQVEAGKAQLEKAVKLKPNYQDARFELGKLYELDGEIEKARLEYLYILEMINPANDSVRERLDELIDADHSED
jgi:putative inorganic carbon (hco3(-)) transporter